MSKANDAGKKLRGMAWLDLTSFRFGRAQDRGNDKNLCRHHPDMLTISQFPRDFNGPLLNW
jgi:hypothetical protein